MIMTFDRFAHVFIITFNSHVCGFTYLGYDIANEHTFALQLDNNPIKYIRDENFHKASKLAFKWLYHKIRLTRNLTEGNF